VSGAALFAATEDRPEDFERFRPVVENQERGAAEAFLFGYTRTVEGCPSYPATAEEAIALLGLFLVEKAAYEIRYEVANRPAWV
jgi:maltose alpha-D-glucosyltransferase/alpha-amylase